MDISNKFFNSNFQKAKALDEKGTILLSDEKYDEALVHFLESVKYNKTSSVLFKIGKCYSSKQKLGIAIEYIDKAIELNEEGSYYLLKGACLNVLGNKSDAIKSFIKCIELNPENLTAYKPLAYLYSDINKWELAVSIWDEYLKLAGDDAEAYSKRGICKGWLGNFNSGISDINKALKLDANNSDFICNRGIVHLLSSNIEAAKIDLEIAERRGCKDASVILKDIRGKVKVKMGELESTLLPNINEVDAKGFLSNISPNEYFYLECKSTPRCILFHTLKYISGRPSFAGGYLLNIDLSDFLRLCGSGKYATLEPILKGSVVGTIHIELDKAATECKIEVRKLEL